MGMYLFGTDVPFRYLRGCFTTFTSSIAIILHVPFIVIFLAHSSFRNQICYRIMGLILFFECTLHIGYLGYGIFTITLSTGNYVLETIVCTLVLTSLYGIYLSNTLLAINRFSIMVINSWFPKSFYSILIGLIFAFCITYLSFTFTPLYNLAFFFELGVGGSNGTGYLSYAMSLIPSVFSIFCLFASLLTYLISIVVLIWQRRRYTGASRQWISGVELRILITALMTFLVCLFDILANQFASSLFLEPLGAARMVATLIVQVSYGYVNVAVYFFMNRDLRKVVLLHQPSTVAVTKFSCSVSNAQRKIIFQRTKTTVVN
ncbi:hypothetical protein L596_026145 [Steinernema carpocapsae]|uniref:G-protein coupled receptors family 1 profile domain-containing protein n=1 Tax=Steinernema carpocapsae TaxID=34508 RepID=A0A4U5M0H2_STECR|nr:hypothetical protein L596_026145 [Steinernema carpocapsae]